MRSGSASVGRLLAIVLSLVGWLHVGDATAQTGFDCPAPPQPYGPAEAEAAMRVAQDRGYLWRIEKDGRVSWLYGTMHVGQREWIFPGPLTLRAMQSAERIALELDLLEPGTQQKMAAAIAIRPNAPPLPATLASRLKAQADAACVGKAVTAMRPEVLAMTLVALSGRSQGLDPAYGIDVMLAGFGRTVGKPVLSLETVEQQLDALLSDDPAEVQTLVTETLDSLENDEVQIVLARLAEAWSESRLDDVAKYEEWCECLNTPRERAVFAKLVDGRNPGMAHAVAALHEGGKTVFAAVGALHMVGPKGLPALLSEKGFKVERVTFAALRGGA